MPLEGADLAAVESGIQVIGTELVGKTVLDVAVSEAEAHSIAVRFDFTCQLNCESFEWTEVGDVGGGTVCPTREAIDFDINALMANYRDGIGADLVQDVSGYVGSIALVSTDPETIAEHLFSHVKVCATCHGHLKVICRNCNAGRVNCTVCSGIGNMSCSYCSGVGTTRESCSACAGRGQIPRETYVGPNRDVYWENCSRCFGSCFIDAPCHNCGQTGSVTCNGCGGIGTKICAVCDGLGEVNCNSCMVNGTPAGKFTHFVKLHFSVRHDGQPTLTLMSPECREWLTHYVAEVQDNTVLREELAAAVSWEEEPADFSAKGDFTYVVGKSAQLTGIEARVDANGKACDCLLMQLTNGRLAPYQVDNFLDSAVIDLIRGATESPNKGTTKNLLSCKLGRWATVELVNVPASSHAPMPAGKSVKRLLQAEVLSDRTYHEFRAIINDKAREFRRKLNQIAVGRTLGGLGAWFAILWGFALAANFVFPAEISRAVLGLSGARSDLMPFLLDGVDTYTRVAEYFVALFTKPTAGLIEWAGFATLGAFLMHRSSARCFEAPTGFGRVRAFFLLAFAFLISSPTIFNQFGLPAIVFMLCALLAAHAHQSRWSIWLQLPVWVVLVAAYASAIGPQHLHSWLQAMPSTRDALFAGIANTVGIVFVHAGFLAVLALLFARRNQWSARRLWKWLLCYGTGWYFLSTQIHRLQDAPEIASSSPLSIWAPLVLFDLFVLAGWAAILKARRRSEKMLARQVRRYQSAPFARLVGVPFS